MKSNFLILLTTALIAIVCNSCEKDKLPELPSLSFSYSNNIGAAPVEVSFEATATNTEEVSWDFGDGQSGKGTTINHTYGVQGLYKVVATATSEAGISIKQTKLVNVSPYTQISISEVHVTMPAATSFYSRIFDSNDSILKQTVYVIAATSAHDTLVPPVIITDFENAFKLKIMNFGSVLSSFTFNPGDYFSSATPFPSTFSKSDASGRTVLLNVSWN